MAYDEALAARVRDLIDPGPDVSERKMFGGLAFLIGGHMAVTASRQGGLMIRVDPADSDDLLETEDCTPMVMRGRDMQGWLRVTGDVVREEAALRAWVRRGVEYARSLPPKD